MTTAIGSNSTDQTAHRVRKSRALSARANTRTNNQAKVTPAQYELIKNAEMNENVSNDFHHAAQPAVMGVTVGQTGAINKPRLKIIQRTRGVTQPVRSQRRKSRHSSAVNLALSSRRFQQCSATKAKTPPMRIAKIRPMMNRLAAV